jgi:hypothetical protein
MLYQAYQTHSDVMVAVRTLAALATNAIGPPSPGSNGIFAISRPPMS